MVVKVHLIVVLYLVASLILVTLLMSAPRPPTPGTPRIKLKTRGIDVEHIGIAVFDPEMPHLYHTDRPYCIRFRFHQPVNVSDGTKKKWNWGYIGHVARFVSYLCLTASNESTKGFFFFSPLTKSEVQIFSVYVKNKVTKTRFSTCVK